ncbi:sulfite exporter TauE/SafE family protein [Nanoarchaeota archaeon]
MYLDAFSFILIMFAGLIITTLSSAVGFGDKIALIAVLTLFIDIKLAIVIAAIYSLIVYSTRIMFFHGHLNKNLLKTTMLFLLPGLAAGLFVFSFINIEILKISFYVFLIFFVLYKLSRLAPDFSIKKKGLCLSVFLFGLLEGAIGAAGPLLGVSLLQYGKRKERFIVFAASLFLISGVIRLIAYYFMGMVNFTDLYLVLPLAFVAVLGTYLAKKLVKILPVKVFEYIVLGLLCVVAVKGLFFS